MRNFYYVLFLLVFSSYSWAQWTESFESGIPADWTIINQGGANGWVTGIPTDELGMPVAAFDGTECAKINFDFAGGHDDYLITPAITVTVGVNGYLSLYAKNGSPIFTDLFDVKVSTNGGVTDADFTDILEANVTPPDTWTNYQYNLNGYAGQTIYVAIQAKSQANNQELDIDFIENFAGPNCPDISNIAVTGNSGDTVTLSWDPGADETTWDIEYDVTGFTPTGVPTLDDVTDNPYEVTGLTSDVTYDFYIRADCGGTDLSEWVGPFTVTTIINYCAGALFTDTGGEDGNYQNNENENWLISPTVAGERVRVTFTEFNTEFSWDFLRVYDGPDNTFPPLHPGVGTADNGFNGVMGVDATTPTTVTSSHPSGSLYVEFISDGFGTRAGWVANVVCEPQPTCPDITQLMASNITGATADLTWVAGAGQTSWSVEYGPVGFTQGTGTLVEGLTEATYTVEGLDPLTDYQFYVQGECPDEDFSVWAGPSNFSTGCATFTPYYEEDFAGMTFAVAPQCWEEANSGTPTDGPSDFGAGGWTQDGFANNGFNGAAKINLWNLGDTGEWLISPLIDLGDGTIPYELKYDIATMQFGSNANQAGFSDDDQVQVLILNNGVWESIVTYDNTNTPVLEVNHIESLAAYTGVVQFAFWATEGTIDDTSDVDVSVDNFIVREVPTCPEVSNATVSNVLSDQVDVNWEENGTATTWEIEYGPLGFAIGTGTVVTVTTPPPFTLTGLDASTEYDLYVRAVCGVDSVSYETAAPSFLTACDSFMPYYEEDFTDMTFAVAPLCWEEANSGLPADGPSDFGAGSWTSDGFANNGFNGAAKINLWNLGDTGEWLISPIIDLGDGSITYELKYDIATMQFGSNATQAGFSDDDQVQVLILNNGVWENLVTYDNTNTPVFELDHIESLAGYTGEVKFAFWGTEGTIDDTSDIDVSIDNFIVREVPTCPQVANAAVSNVLWDQVDVTWEEAGTADTWEIEYGPTGFELGTGTIITVTTPSPYTITGLDSVTGYDVYIRAICDVDDVSFNTGPLSFTTLCALEVPEYIETFDLFVPDCWEEADNGDLVTGPTGLGAGSWAGDGFANDGFTGAAKINLWNLGKNDWLISPLIDLGDGSIPYELVYDVATVEFAGTELEGFSDDDAIHVVVIQDGTYTLLESWDNTNTPVLELEHIVPLNDFTGIVQIAFYGTEGTINDSSDVDASIDNFIVREQPPCPKPFDITLVDFTTDSAEFTWQGPDNAIEYIVTYVTSGGDPLTDGVTVSPNPTTNSVTITGLEHSTAYDLYVTTDCGDVDGMSEMLGPHLFQTAIPNDECENAVMLTSSPIGEACSTAVSGSISGATDSGIEGCTPSPDDDVWYTFEAISTNQKVTISDIIGSSIELKFEVFSGDDCDNLTSIFCSNNLSSELVDYDIDGNSFGLCNIGETYYIRVFTAENTPQDSAFLICVTATAPEAENGNCGNAIYVGADELPYSNSQYDYVVAEQDQGIVDGCAGGTNDGVWYEVEGNGDNYTVEVTPINGYNVEVGVYSSACGEVPPVVVGCSSFAGTDGVESTNFATEEGTTYYINVGHYSSVTDFPEGDFDIEIYVENLGIEDIENTLTDSVLYPNPTNGTLRYSGDKSIDKIIAHDLSGALVNGKITMINAQEFNIANFPEGVYFMTISFEDGSTESYKVIKN